MSQKSQANRPPQKKLVFCLYFGWKCVKMHFVALNVSTISQGSMPPDPLAGSGFTLVWLIHSSKPTSVPPGYTPVTMHRCPLWKLLEPAQSCKLHTAAPTSKRGTTAATAGTVAAQQQLLSQPGRGQRVKPSHLSLTEFMTGSCNNDENTYSSDSGSDNDLSESHSAADKEDAWWNLVPRIFCDTFT